MHWLLQYGRGGGGGGVNYVRLIGLLVVVGFSVLSWVLRKLQEQSAKKRAREAIEQRELELLRTGRTPAGQAPITAGTVEMPPLPAPASQSPSDVDRRIEELRRRREAMAQRRAADGARVQSAPTAATPPAPRPPSQRPPIVFIPGSSGPIVVPRPRTARAASPVPPPAPAPVRPAATEARPAPSRPTRRSGRITLADKLEQREAAQSARAALSDPPPPVTAGGAPAPRSPAEWRRAIIAREILSPDRDAGPRRTPPGTPLVARSLSRIRVGAMAAALAAGAGCEINTKPGAKTIWEAFSDLHTPGEYAEMATNPYDANDRYIGTLGLASMPFAGEPIYVRLFQTNIRDADPSVRVAAIRGLSMHGDASDALLLVEMLSDKDRLVRVAAARGLQRIHNEAAIDPLINAVREPDPRQPKLASEPDAGVRAQAAIALGQYAQRKVLQALIAALDDSDLSVNRGALYSLRVLTGQDLGLDRAAWLSWLEKAQDPFAGRNPYFFPIFHRTRTFFEYFPLMSPPPNEVPAPPAGQPEQ